MVRDLAVLAWKKIRLENLELRFTLARLNAPLDYFDKKDTQYLSSHQVENILDQLCDYTSELKKEAELAVIYAEQLQVNGATAEDLESLEKSHPLIHKRLIAEIEEFDFTHPTAKNVLEYEIENDDGKTERFWTYFLKIAIEGFSQAIWLCENRDAIEQELQAVKDRRLMVLMENEKPSRAFDDLRRNFYRTLSELRKHQEWKRKMQVVDVALRNEIDSGEEGALD
jgi:hypothetical protein